MMRIIKHSNLARSALATAVGLAVAGAHADLPTRSNIRLALTDEISSRVESESESFTGRIEVDSLIQSHPDPLFAELEQRYQALPPFTEATESIPERYILEESSPARMIASARQAVSNVARFVPNIRTQVRHDDIREEVSSNNSDNPGGAGYSSVLTTFNPTFQYRAEQRKWLFQATYDYERGQYHVDQDNGFNDHVVNIDWSRRLAKGNEFRVNALVEDTHDRVTRDPIRDFDSALESQDLKYDRYLVNLLYQNGTRRNRTHYEIYLFNEKSDLESGDLLTGGYGLDRVAFGGTYAWQFRRQMSLVAEARLQQFDYDLAFRDNQHYRAMFGTDLILGRRLKANFRVGYEEKAFDVSIGDDSFSDTVWDGMVEWAVRRRTSVKLETGREIFELATVDNPIDAGKFNVQSWVRTAWEEQWSEKFTTEASYTYRETDIEGQNAGEEADQLLLTADYQLSNRWKISLDGAYTRQNIEGGSEIKRRTFTLRTDYTL